jgi:hypothetical protein
LCAHHEKQALSDAMLQRNLLYTGVARGNRLVVLVRQKKGIAVRNVSGRRRCSKLAEWLTDVSKRYVSMHDVGRHRAMAVAFFWRVGKCGTTQLRRFKHAPGMSASPPNC